MEQKKKTGLFKRLLEKMSSKRRVVIMDKATFEVKRTLIFSGWTVFFFIAFVFIVISAATFFMISYTPAKTLIPGFNEVIQYQRLKAELEATLIHLDEFEHKAEVVDLYYKTINDILNERIPDDPSQEGLQYIDTTKNYRDLKLPKSTNDSLLRRKVDESEKYNFNLNYGERGDDNTLYGVFFFKPIEGTVSNSINISEGHYGVDVVATVGTPVKATLDGTVILAEWTPNDGYVVHIQHQKNVVSVYKHNSTILKKVGNKVKAGDVVAILGNSGKHTSGPHLHFEIWQNGNPINPQAYIVF